MNNKVKVSTQGISSDFNSATGDYNEVNHGEKDQFELYDIFQKVEKINFPTIKEDDDFCYPNIIIEDSEKVITTFSSSNGKLVLNETNTEISPKDAAKYVFGEIKIDKREKLKEVREKEGKIPAFKKEITPTDREKVNFKNIDTSFNSPQISMKVWKSSGWKEFTYWFPISVSFFLFFVGLAVLGEKQDAEYAPIFFLIGFLILLLIFPLRALGRHEFRLGFDWKTNTLWCWRSNKGIVGFECDANMIKSFSCMDNSSKSFNFRWYSNSSQSMYMIKKSWILMVLRVTSEHWFGVSGGELATKKEAIKISEQANILLKNQM